MTGIAILRVLGGVLIIVGLALVSSPELVVNKPIPSDTFEAVERRIWWGCIIGVGLLPFFHLQMQPWLSTVLAVLCALIFGMLIARFIGIALDGSVIKQWKLVGVEAAVFAPLLWWYLKTRS